MQFKKFILISWVLLVFCLKGSDAFAADNVDKPEDIMIKATGKSLDDFVPEKWKIIGEARGDLNKDKLTDIVAVIEYTGEYNAGDEELIEGQPRILFILFMKKEGTYKLSVQSANLILRSDEGGVFGDPFVGVECSRGSIVVSFYGGSSWRWGYTYRFRFQNKAWYLIGETDETQNINTDETKTIDTNYLTGKQITTTIDINGKKSVLTRNNKRNRLKKITDY